MGGHKKFAKTQARKGIIVPTVTSAQVTESDEDALESDGIGAEVVDADVTDLDVTGADDNESDEIEVDVSDVGVIGEEVLGTDVPETTMLGVGVSVPEVAGLLEDDNGTGVTPSASKSLPVQPERLKNPHIVGDKIGAVDGAFVLPTIKFLKKSVAGFEFVGLVNVEFELANEIGVDVTNANGIGADVVVEDFIGID